MQSFARAFMCDWQWGQGGSFQGVDDAGAAGFDRTKAVFSLGDSGAPFPNATALTVTNLGGPIGQWQAGVTFPLAKSAIATSWGTSPSMLVYWLSPGELLTTHAAADPTSPRWDLVCVKLSDVNNDSVDVETRMQKQVVGSDFVISAANFVKRRKVALTKQVVVGTPAGSPAIPAVPAGFQPLYAVKIPAAFAAAFPIDNDFHDYRMPLGAFTVDVNASEVLGANAVGVTQVGGPNASAGTTAAYPTVATSVINTIIDFIPQIPVPPSACRLIGISSLNAGSLSVWSGAIGRYLAASDGTFSLFGGNSTWDAITMTNPSISGWTWTSSRLTNQAGNATPTAAIKPPWGTGYPSGYAARAERTIVADTHAFIGARMRVAGSGGKIAIVRFHFAGMNY
jgi:hypothetical protein